MLHKLLNLGLLSTPETLKQFDTKVLDWMEVLLPSVPLEALNAAYLRAVQLHGDGYFLKVTEVLAAWEVLRAEAASDVKALACRFCSLYEEDPRRYPPCPFHSKTEQVTHLMRIQPLDTSTHLVENVVACGAPRTESASFNTELITCPTCLQILGVQGKPGPATT